MPLRILQNNNRVAEVQFVCDSCGKLAKTSMIPKKDIDTFKNKAVTCWQCKQIKTGKRT